MLTIEDIKGALINGRNSFDDLQTHYRRLPSTRCECETPGVCCRFMPEMTFLEVLQWIDAMSRLPADRRSALICQFVLFYLITPLRQPGCPFLGKGGECTIYRERPFACRAYGLWGTTTGQARTEQHRDGKKAIILNWRNLGIQIQEDAVAFEMDYCTRVHSNADRSLTDNDIMAVLNDVYALDDSVGIWRDQFETNYHSDFSYLLTAMLFGARKAVLSKIAVIKEIAEMGTDRRLHKYLSQMDDQPLSKLFENGTDVVR
jgi:Fe-S-cluster containining protein